jgi:hypothetical protein
LDVRLQKAFLATPNSLSHLHDGRAQLHGTNVDVERVVEPRGTQEVDHKPPHHEGDACCY